MADRANHRDDHDRFEVGYHLSPPTFYSDEEHDKVQICIPMRRARYRVDRQSASGRQLTHELGSRDILVLPTGQTHAITWRQPAGVVTLYLSDAFLSKTLESPVVEFSDALTLRDPFVSAAAAQLGDALETAGSLNSLYAEALVTAIACRIGANAGTWTAGRAEKVAPLTRAQCARIDGFMEAHLDRRLSLAELAALVGMSNWHFLRRFSATHGATPHAYLIAKRCERASRLLRETSLPITRIALEIGMSHSHFSRTFLQRYGMSPTELRVQGRAAPTLACLATDRGLLHRASSGEEAP